MFVAPVNQKSDGSIFFLYSSSLVSAQRISLDERLVTRTDPVHFQGMDFRRSRYNESVAQFVIFLLLSSPMSESFSCRWKTWHYLKAPKWGIYFSFSRWMLINLNESSLFRSLDSWFASSSCLCFVDLMLLFVTVDSFVSKWDNVNNPFERAHTLNIYLSV